jgi:hypothetical protein
MTPDEQFKARRKNNARILGGILIALVMLIYFVTIARMGAAK